MIEAKALQERHSDDWREHSCMRGNLWLSHPLSWLWGCFLFGGVQALQLRLQAIGTPMPTYLLMMAPYGFTILALVLVSRGKMRRQHMTPAALGMPYIRGE
jgi:ABC-type uncharacterized transport system permease subunit